MDLIKIGGDAGHAGFGVTPGKRPPDSSFYEWDFNNKVMVLIERKLRDYENVQFVRLDDRTGKRDVPLTERKAKAKNAGVDAVVSMHANAYGSGGWNESSGIETFISADGLPASELILASHIQNHLIRDLGRKNRGVKKGNLFMTKVSKDIPSVLVEAGFMTNREEAVLLMSSSYQEKTAEAVVKGLAETFKLKRKKIDVPKETLQQTQKGVDDLMLKLGDKGEAVKVLNHQLASLGYTGWDNRENDEFRPFTEDALKRFQTDQKVYGRKPATGIYDFETARAFALVLSVYHKHWVETH
ncbi:N-acetylmuramoyl-L-alanine amidase [Bacillus sp. PAMC26568]|nr:N-acetylmuramoyl-L-alanine amidase [Bacillus sp. PAMC26568]